MKTSLLYSITKALIRKIGKKVISYKILLSANITPPIRIDLPFNIRGEGKNINIGQNSRIGKNSFLNCKGPIYTKQTAHFHINTIVYVGISALINIGKNFNLGANSIIRTNNNKWTFGDNISISTNCAFFAREKGHEGILEIGNNSNISDNTIIDTCDDVIIGDNVAIGNNCTIFTHNHVYTDKTKPAWKGGIKLGKVIINDGAWVGSNVIIMPGISVGKRAVIAAGSVLTKNIPDEVIVAGVPAKIIKHI